MSLRGHRVCGPEGGLLGLLTGLKRNLGAIPIRDQPFPLDLEHHETIHVHFCRHVTASPHRQSSGAIQRPGRIHRPG